MSGVYQLRRAANLRRRLSPVVPLYRHASSCYFPVQRQTQTPLAVELSRQILFGGAISVDQYMRLCLTHPKYGYYKSAQPIFGPRGDFVTAPEVSQVYGELIAVWVADITRQIRDLKGTTASFALAELGPGNGTLMNDILRVLTKLDSCPAKIHLVETSSSLQDVQRRCLADVCKLNHVALQWHTSLDGVPDKGGEDTDSLPVIYVAQEFFDALPVHVFQRDFDSEWRERMVDIIREDGELSSESQFGFRFVLAPGDTPALSFWKNLCSSKLVESPWSPSAAAPGGAGHIEDQVVELCADGLAIAEELGNRISRSGGAAILMDYGYESQAPLTGNTLRAIRGHELVPILSAPGLCDVTADVNFSHLKQIAGRTDSVFHGSITQREFLLGLGAAARFRALGMSIVEDSSLNNDVKETSLTKLQQDYDRLVSPDQMGTLYRAAAITHKSIVPLGFGPRR